MTTGPTGPETGRETQQPAGRGRRSSGMSSADKQEFSRRMVLLKSNGASNYLLTNPQTIVDLAGSNLTDNEMLSTWLEGLMETTAISGIEKFKEHADDYQKAAFGVFDPLTQEYLRSYGYEIPHDHLDWWNPGDWGQIATRATGMSGKSWGMRAATFPGFLLAQTTQGISDTIKYGWQGVETAERFSSRMFRTMIDNAKNEDSQLEWFNPLKFDEYWANSEYHHASFTTESKAKAADLLGNQEHFNIMISIRRYGDAEQGLYEHFFGTNGGDGAKATADMYEFLASEVPISSEWLAASKALDEGSTNAGDHAMGGWKNLVYQVPEYMGGLRGQPDAPLEDASGFWTKGYAVSGFTAEMFGSIAFDPLNSADIWLSSRRLGAARPGITATSGKNWVQTVDDYHRSAAGMRAYLNAKELKRNNQSIATAGQGSRITNGMLINADEGIKENFKRWASETIEEETDLFDRSSFSLRSNLKGMNDEIEYINNAFREYNVWKRNSIEAAAAGEKFLVPDPALGLLSLRSPAYRDSYPLLLQYHENARWGPYSGVDNVGEGSELLTGRLGLDSYDGVWDFYKDFAGAQAIGGRLLGGYIGDKLFFPRLGWAAKARLRAGAIKRSLLGKGTPLDERPGIWAESFNNFVNTQNNIVSDVMYNKLQEHIINPSLYPEFEGLSDAAVSLSQFELTKLFNDPRAMTDVLLHGGYPAYRNMTLRDIEILLMAQTKQVQGTVDKLQDIYIWVQDNKSLDDLPPELVLSDPIMDILKNNWPDISASFTYWDNLPGPMGRHHPNFLSQGVNYVRNRRLGYLHSPGSAEGLLLSKFPERIVRTGEKTWEELLDIGYNVGPMRVDLTRAGYNNPNELLAAIDEFSLKEVAEQVGVKASDLRLFLKNKLHTAVSENKFYDAAGKIKDAALVGLYTGAVAPFKLHEMLFTHVPTHKYIDVKGMNINDAMPIKEFEAFIKTGIRSHMPRTTMDWYISEFVHGSEARRWDIITDVVTEIMGRGGALRYGGRNVKASWDKFVRGADMIYGNTGADQFLSRGRMMPRAISPAQAHEGFVSQANIIPDWRQIGEMTQYMGYMRYLGYNLGLPQIDKLIQKAWVPAALFKFGLGPRNAVDELLIAVLNHGPTFYIDAKLSNIAMNRTKIFDSYGNRIIQDKDAIIGLPPVDSTDLVVVNQADQVQSQYEMSVNYSQTGRQARTLWGARLPLWAYNNMLDMLRMGRGKGSNTRALEIAIAQNPNWHIMTDQAKDVALQQAVVQRHEGIWAGRIGSPLRHLGDMAETISHQMSGTLNAGAKAMPTPLKAIGVAPFNETAERILRRNEVQNYRAARILIAHELTAQAYLEGILAPYRTYYDITQRPYAAEKLLAGQGFNDPNLIEMLQLDYSESALAWRFPTQTEPGIIDNIQAAAQHVAGYWTQEPSYRAMSNAVASYVGPQTLKQFDEIITRLRINIPNDPEVSASQNAARSIRYVYEKIDSHTRNILRDMLDAEASKRLTNVWDSKAGNFPKVVQNEIVDWDFDIAAEYFLKHVKDDDLRSILKGIFELDDPMQVLSLLAIRNLDSRLFDIDSSVITKRAITAGTDELMTIDGRDRLHAMVRTDGVDPQFTRTQRPTTESEIRLFHPETTASEAMNLAYMFTNPSTPAGETMYDGLKEFLSFYLESETHAVSVINSMNPVNSPHGSMMPAQWLKDYLVGSPEALAMTMDISDSPQSIYTAVQFFLMNSSEPALKNINVPVLTGSRNPFMAEKVGFAIRRWHDWLQTDVSTEGIRAVLEASDKTPENILVRPRIVSRSEYKADAAFGRTFGVTVGNRNAVSGISAPTVTPPRVFVQGDQWMHSEGMPNRWTRIEDDKGNDLWELQSLSPEGIRGKAGQIWEKRIISRREYMESEIMNTMRGFATLPDESVVQYFYSPSMRGDPLYENVYQYYYESVPSKSIAPAYDLFGARMERVVDLINEYSDGTRTWGEFEDAIWRRFGDAPVTAKKGIGPSIKIDDLRDLIGTVGEGPIGQHGFRRIFHEYAENDIIPQRRLIKEPLGDINDFPGRDRLPMRPWLGDQMVTRGGPTGQMADIPAKVVFGEEQLKDYMQVVESFAAEMGTPISGVAKEFYDWRQALLTRHLSGQSIDTVWPLYRDPPQPTPPESIIPKLTWDDLRADPDALRELNAERLAQEVREANRRLREEGVPSFFQETRAAAETRNIPIDFDVRSGGEVSPVERLVRSQLNNFPQADMPRNLWVFDGATGRSVTPGAIGGFDETVFPFVAVNPHTMGVGFEEIADVSTHRLNNEWRHRNTGDTLWLRDGAEKDMTSFRGLTARAVTPPDVGPPVTSADPSVIPQRNTDALIDIKGANIEHHKGVIDVPFDILDSEIMSAPPSPIDPNFRSKKNRPETPQYNHMDVKKTVTVLDHQYEMIVDGRASAVAMPRQTKASKRARAQTTRGTQEKSDPFAYHSSTEVGEARELRKSGGSGPLTDVEVDDLILIRPRAVYRKKPGEVERKLIAEGRIQGDKRGKDVSGGGAPYPVKVTEILSASRVGAKEFSELMKIPLQDVKDNWTSGRSYSRYQVAIFERIKGTSGWQGSHLNIDDKRWMKPMTRVMGDPGTSYYYTGKNFVAQPWTPIVAEIKRRVEQLTGYEFDLVIAQRYADGKTTLGYHYDRIGTTYDPEEIVVSVNFGATRRFQFRPRRRTQGNEQVGEGTGKPYGYKELDREPGPPVDLAQGDVLAMMEGTNANWEHSVIGGQGRDPRINLTFRRLDSQTQKQVRFQDTPGPMPTHSSGLVRIISGGQNGADEAGLLAAKDLGIPTGGTATKGFKTTLGPKPEQAEQFGLTANQTTNYLARTRTNVYNADGTVIFSQTPELSGGSKRTYEFAIEYGQTPHVVTGTGPKAQAAFLKWLEDENIRTLNVAGSRLWERAGVLRGKEDFQDRVQQFLVDALRGTDDAPPAAPAAAVDGYGKTIADYEEEIKDARNYMWGMQGGGSELTGPLDHILYVPLTHGEYIDEFEKVFPNWKGKPAIGVPGDMQIGSGAHDQAIQAWDIAFDTLIDSRNMIEDLTSAAPAAAPAVVDDLPVPEEYLGDLSGLHDYETGELITENPTVGDLVAKADELEGEFWAKVEQGLEINTIESMNPDEFTGAYQAFMGGDAEYVYTGLTSGGAQSIFRQLARQGEIEVPYIVSDKGWEAGDDLWEAYIDDFLTRYPDKDPIIFLSRELEEFPTGGVRESGVDWSHLDAIGRSVREWLEGYALRKTAMKVADDVPAPTAAAAVETGPVRVWAGTNPANAVLSNITEVPNRFLFRGRRFRSPEAAYQAHKSGKGYDNSKNWTELNGWDAKKAGRGKPVDTDPNSATNSIVLMREIVETRLIQDPEFMKALAATGDRPIVHPSGDIWETEYPRALTDARPRAQQIVGADEPPFTPVTKTAQEEMDNGEWELISQQYLGKYDDANAAEQFARTGFREMMFLITNENRQAFKSRGQTAVRSGTGEAIGGMATDLPGTPGVGEFKPDNHYSWLLEATDPIGGQASSARMLAVRDDSMVPHRISAKAPSTASNRFDKRFEGYKQSFFQGAIQPMINAMIREPLYFHNFKEARALLAGTRTLFHHDLARFKGLERAFETPSASLVDEVTGEVWTGARPSIRRVDDGGNEQWRLVDESTEVPDPDQPKRTFAMRSSFDDFAEEWYHNLSRLDQVKDDPMSRMSHLMAQYFDRTIPPNQVIDDMFYVDKRWVYEYETIISPDGVKKEVPLRNPDGSHVMNPVWDIGPFYETFGPSSLEHRVRGEGFEGFFWAMKKNHPEEYAAMKKNIVELLANRITVEAKHAELAIERAAGVTARFVDNHSVRTQFQEMLGTALPFHFAQMQFLQRWGRTLKYHPAALTKLNWGLLAAQRSGMMYEDNNEESRVLIPGSEFISQFMFELAAVNPAVRAIYNEQNFGVLADEYSARTDRMSPGYDMDNIANATVGPMISTPVNLMAMFDPHLVSDEWMGPSLVSQWAFMSEGLDPTTEMFDQKAFFQIVFGSTLPAPVVNIGNFIISLVASNIFGTTSTATDKALFDAVYLLGMNNMLPDPERMASLSPTDHNLLNQDVFNSFTHVAQGLMAIRTVTGFFGPTQIAPTSLENPKDWEWNEKFQRLLDEGALSHEAAFDQMYQEYYEEFIEEQTAAGVTDQLEIDTLWQREILRISVFSVGKTGKDTIAALPQTVAAFEWMDTPGAREFLNTFPVSGGFFIPRGLTEEGREWDVQAANRYIAIEMRYRREPDEFVEAIYTNSGAIEYFRKSLQHKELLAQYRLAKKDKTPNYVDSNLTWSETIFRAEKEWDLWAEQYKDTHPIFAASLFEQGSEKRREETIKEMITLLGDPTLIPDAPHKDDILILMEDIVVMDGELDTLQDATDSTATKMRNSIKKRYYEHWIEAVKNRPWLYELYYNLLIPLISEDWVIKYNAGTHEYEG